MKVVIGFIENQNRLLITQRALNSHFGGFWELPGGKVEINETPSQALIREFNEELGLEVHTAGLICQLCQGSIEFYLYEITQYKNEAQLLAGQLSMAWVTFDELQQYVFPPTNRLFFEIWESYKREIPS